MLVDALSLREAIRYRVRGGEHDLFVFWFQVTSDREGFRRQLRHADDELSVVPLVIRGERFGNPNAMLSDLVRLMEDNRTAFGGSEIEGAIAIVLLAMVPLQVPQLSSPITMPEWFPRLGGRNVHVVVEDLTYTADVPLNAGNLRVDRLCEQLWRLEAAIVDRISVVHKRDHRCTNALLDLMREHDRGVSVQSAVDGSRAYRMRFQEPGGFRPSAKDKNCFVARLVILATATSPDKLSSRCAAIAEALDCSRVTTVPADSLPALLLRPTQKDANVGVQFARNLVVTVYASVQLINATAHSGEYGRYPILLLMACSHDLQTKLGALGDAIDALGNCDGT